MTAIPAIPLPLQTPLLLLGSNLFMTFAWYGHLKNLSTAPWYAAAPVPYTHPTLPTNREVLSSVVAVCYKKKIFIKNCIL